jgi:Tol biopolymer transport system component
MSRAFVRLLRTSLACVWLGAAASVAAASTFDPILRFRTLRTEHFIIHFHQGEEELARRLADIAEETWLSVSGALGLDAPGRTHVVLVDQEDTPIGWATPLPYNTVVVGAAWPSGSEFLGITDDWLRLVFVHEFAHIVHLDRSVGWARLVRGVFGRAPLAFPNLFLPAWQIEGLATFEETARTGAGRLTDGGFRLIDRSRLPLDRAAGGLSDWPGAYAPYAFGGGFHGYLAERFGEERLGELAQATAGRVPFMASPMFKRLFGESLGDLWNQYQRSVAKIGAPGDGDGAGPHRITHHGYVTSAPRFAPSCTGCGEEIIYTRLTPHEYATLNVVSPAGGRETELVTRYGGATHGTGGSSVVFDRPEVRRNAGVYSDLYRLDRPTGRVERLTKDARLRDPDVSPDGTTIVSIREGLGRRELVLLSVPSGEPAERAPIRTLVSEAETQFNAPRWAPDGRQIVVERHSRGAQSEIAIVDAATGRVRPLSPPGDKRFVTPTWRRDGHAIVAAGAASGAPFNLFELPIEPGAAIRQLTAVEGGATWPDVSADGGTIVYVGYESDGFDLFVMPYPTAGSAAGGDIGPPTRTPTPLGPRATGSSDLTPAGYSPWQTLVPRSWLPVVEVDGDEWRLGGTVAGTDVLGYHSWFASASWLVSNPSPGVSPDRSTPDWSAAYGYTRWQPIFVTAASRNTVYPTRPADAPAAPVILKTTEHRLEAGASLPVRRFEYVHVLAGSVIRSVDDHELPAGARAINRSGVRAAWMSSTPNTYGYSISPEGGVALSSTVELTRPALGASGSATTVTIDGRAYLPGLARHHVVALRGAAGASTGDAEAARIFRLGGGGSNVRLVDYGSDALSLLRGFEPDRFLGRRVALVNADYRWPFLRPQRGAGTWPFFVHTLHAAATADVGQAWTDRARRGDWKTSLGGELAANVVLGYSYRFTFVAGAAWGHDPSGRSQDRVTGYVRVGGAF